MTGSAQVADYEWRINNLEGYGDARCTGSDSDELLGLLFTIWMKNRGDVSDWDERIEFGNFIGLHSDLMHHEIAIWLNLPVHKITAQPDTDGKSIEFTGPNGDRHRLKRVDRQ